MSEAVTEKKEPPKTTEPAVVVAETVEQPRPAGGNGDASVALSQQVMQPGDKDVLAVVASDRNATSSSAEANLPKVKIAENEAATLDANALKEKSEELHKAIHRGGWFFGAGSDPDNDAIRRILEPLNKQDRANLEKAYHDAYDSKGGADTLRRELKDKLNDVDWRKAEAILNRQDGRTNDAGNLMVAITHANKDKDKGNAEIRAVLSTLNSKQLAQLDEDFKQAYGKSYKEALDQSKDIQKATKEALPILMKGTDQRTAQDQIDLANIALTHKDKRLFGESLRGDGPAATQARQRLANDQEFKDRMAQAFPSDEAKMYGKNAHKHLPWEKRVDQVAIDYLQEGRISLATITKENTDSWLFENKDNIELAARNASAKERQDFTMGRDIINSGRQPQNEQEKQAVDFYNKIHKTFKDRGNDRETSIWEDQLVNGRATIITEMAKTHSDGWGPFDWGEGHGKNDIMSKVEKLSKEDWELLRSPNGANFRRQIEESLKTYADEGERRRIMSMLDAKAGKESYDEAAKVQRSIHETITDNKGSKFLGFGTSYDGKNISRKIAEMSEDDVKKYKNDASFRDDLNKFVEDNLDGTERVFARRLLAQVERTGQPPKLDAIDTVLSDKINGAKPETLLRHAEKALQENPQLRERLNKPHKELTEEERTLKTVIQNAISERMYEPPESGQYRALQISEKFFKEGKFDIQTKLELGFERKGIIAEVAAVPAEQREQYLKLLKKDEQEIARAIAGNPDGKPSLADSMRAFVIGAGGDHSDFREELKKLNFGQIEQLKNEYAKKYGDDLDNAFLNKVPEKERQTYKELLTPAENDGGGQAYFDNVQAALKSATGHAPDGTELTMERALSDQGALLADFSSRFEKLSKEDQEKANKYFQEAIEAYKTSKEAYAEKLYQAAVIVGGVGIAIATGGAAVPALLAFAAVSAAGRVALMRGIQGEDYDLNLGNIAKDGAIGFATGAFSVLGPETLVAFRGVGTVAAGRFLAIGGDVAANSLKSGGQRILASEIDNLVGQAVMKGQPIERTALREVARKVAKEGTDPDTLVPFLREAVEQSGREVTDVMVKGTAKSLTRETASWAGFGGATNVVLEGSIGVSNGNLDISNLPAAFLTGAIPGGAMSLAFKGVGAAARPIMARLHHAPDGGTLIKANPGEEFDLNVKMRDGSTTPVRVTADGTHLPADAQELSIPGMKIEGVEARPLDAPRPTDPKLDGTVTVGAKADETISTHAPVYEGTLNRPDGSTAKVFFHSEDTVPEWQATRVRNEQAGHDLNTIIGFDNGYPAAREATVNIDGKPVKGWVQESAGESFEKEIRRRVQERFGNEGNLDENITKLMNEDPALRAKVEQALVERMVYGDKDINVSNLAISSDGSVRNLDLGHAFSTDKVPALDTMRARLADVGIHDAFGGKPLSAPMRQKLDAFVNAHQSPEARAQLASRLGLSGDEVDAVVERARHLKDNGIPPAKPEYVDADARKWYRAVEDAHRPRGSAQPDAVVAAAGPEAVVAARTAAPEGGLGLRVGEDGKLYDVDGRLADGTKFRENIARRFSVTGEDLPSYRQLGVIREELSQIKGSDGVNVYQKLEDFRDASGNPLSQKQKDRILDSLAEVREHYVRHRMNEVLDVDQETNWIHTQGELGRVLDSARANKLSSTETEDALLASMFSDSVKNKANFTTHHLDGALAADQVLRKHLGDDFTQERLLGITQAVREHQISPPGFMAMIYGGAIRGQLAAESPTLLEAATKKLSGGQLSEREQQILEAYSRRHNQGKELNSDQLDAIKKDLEAKKDKPGTYLTDADVALTKSINDKLYFPLDGETQGFTTKLTPEGGKEVVFTDAEKDLLRRVGVENWYVPSPDTPWYKISRALIDGDSIDNYATAGGAGKIVKIRGPETDQFFRDRQIDDSIKSITSSREQSLRVMTEEGKTLLNKQMAETEQSIAAAKNRTENWIREAKGIGPNEPLGDVPFWNSDLKYPQRMKANEAARIDGKLDEWKRIDQIPSHQRTAAERKTYDIYSEPDPAAEAKWWSIHKKPTESRTAEEQAWYDGHRYDGLSEKEQDDFLFAGKIRDRLAEELRREQRVAGDLPPDYLPIEQIRAREAELRARDPDMAPHASRADAEAGQFRPAVDAIEPVGARIDDIGLGKLVLHDGQSAEVIAFNRQHGNVYIKYNDGRGYEPTNIRLKAEELKRNYTEINYDGTSYYFDKDGNAYQAVKDLKSPSGELKLYRNKDMRRVTVEDLTIGNERSITRTLMLDADTVKVQLAEGAQSFQIGGRTLPLRPGGELQPIGRFDVDANNTSISRAGHVFLGLSTDGKPILRVDEAHPNTFVKRRNSEEWVAMKDLPKDTDGNVVINYGDQVRLGTSGEANLDLSSLQKADFQVGNTRFKMTPGETITLGRDNIDPANKLISAKHAQLGIDQNGRAYIFEDPAKPSTNGTYIKRKGSQEYHKITPGDRVHIFEGDQVKLGATDVDLSDFYREVGPQSHIQNTGFLGRLKNKLTGDPEWQPVDANKTAFRHKDGTLYYRESGREVWELPNGAKRIKDNSGAQVVESGGKVRELTTANGVRYRYDYGDNGLSSVTFADGTVVRSVGGNEWTQVAPDGTLSQYKGKFEVDSDGTLHYQGDDGTQVKYKPDGSREVANPNAFTDAAGHRYRVEGADVKVERAKLDTSARASMTDTEFEYFQNFISAFENRVTDLNERAVFYHHLNSLLADNPAAVLSLRERSVLAQQVMQHTAHPNTIDQGDHLTCNVTTVEKKTALEHPAEYARMISEVANTGKYTTASGFIVDMVPTGALKMDNDAALAVQRELAVKMLGDSNRSWASKIFQETGVNIHWSRRNFGESGVVNGTPDVPTGFYRFVNKGAYDAIAGPDGGTMMFNRFDKYGVQERARSPYLHGEYLEHISNEITGANEGQFYLSRNLWQENHWQLGHPNRNGFQINNVQDLSQQLMQLQDNGKHGILWVDVRNEPFWQSSGHGAAGGAGGHSVDRGEKVRAHVVLVKSIDTSRATVVGYRLDPKTGRQVPLYDPNTVRVEIWNSWGRDRDLVDQNRPTLQQIYNAMTPYRKP